MLEPPCFSENAGYFSILLELASTVGAPGSHKVVLVLLVQFRQNLSHGREGHEQKPGVDSSVGKLFRESTMGEPTEHGAESGVHCRLHVIGKTPAVALWT